MVPPAAGFVLDCGRIEPAIYFTNRPQRLMAVSISRANDGDPDVTEADIEAKVIDIVAEQMSVEKTELSRDTSFVNDLNADSLDTVELVMELEDEFETSIPDEDAEKIQTVGQAVEFILKANSNKG